jgi:hypothetical protein
MTQRTIVLVVGGPDAGKTTLTKALGAVIDRRRGDSIWSQRRNVEAGIILWVRTRALNEPPYLTLEELHALFDEVERAAVAAGVVMAIRPRGPRGGHAKHTTLEGLVGEARGRGWRPVAVVLDPGWRSAANHGAEARVRLEAAGVPFVTVDARNQDAASHVPTVIRLLCGQTCDRPGEGQAE